MAEMKMNSVGSLWRDAWRLYTDRFAVVMQIIVPPVVLLALGNIFQAIGGLPMLIAASILLAAGVLLSIVAAASIIHSFHQTTGFQESYQVGGRLFWRLIWVTILVGLAYLGGFVMLIIPGIWLGLALIFSNYVLVIEGKHGLAALMQSREYVKGYWWAIFGRLLLFAIAFGVAYLVIGIPFSLIGGAIGWAIASAILTLFVIPFSVAYYYTMYRNLTALKPQVHDAASTSGRKTFLIVALVIGVILMFFAALGIVSGAILGPRTYPGYRPCSYAVNCGSDGYGQLPPGNAAMITSISPTSGPVDTTVTIYGNGFAATNTVELGGLVAPSLKNLPAQAVSGGPASEEITFTVPQTLGPNCSPNEACPDFLMQVTPRVYQVSVMEGDGMTNAVPFTVTGKAATLP